MKKIILVVGIVVVIGIGVVLLSSFYKDDKVVGNPVPLATNEVKDITKELTVNTPNTDWQEYVGSDFSMSHPSLWTKNAKDSIIYFLAPKEQGFSANIGIISLKTNTSIEFDAKESKRLQEINYEKFSLIQEGNTTIDNYPAYQRVYSWYDSSHKVSLTQIQAWIKPDNIMYVITASSLSDLYTVYENDFLTAIKSFKIN